jgi:hypothetical protein
MVTNSAKGGGQAENIIIDARGTGLSEEEAMRAIARIFGEGNIPATQRIGQVEIIGDGYFITPGAYP